MNSDQTCPTFLTKHILCLYLFSLLILFVSGTSFGFAFDTLSNQSTIGIADRQLTIDKESYELVTKQFFDLKTEKEQQFQVLQEKGIAINTLKHAQLDFIAAKAAIEGADIALTDAKESIEDTNSAIRTSEKNLQSLILLTKGNPEREAQIISFEAQLEFLKRLQQIQNDRIDTLNQIKEITQQRLKLESMWQQKLQILFSIQQQDAQRNHLAKRLADLQQQQQDWLLKLSNLNHELEVLNHQNKSNDTSLKKLHLRILEAEEKVALIRLKSYLVQIQNRVENLKEQSKSQKLTTQLNELVDHASSIQAQLDSSKAFVNSKMNFVMMKEREVETDLQKQLLSAHDTYGYSHMLSQLVDDYNDQINLITDLSGKTAFYQKEFKLQLQHHLSERQKFPSDLAGWIVLSNHMLQIPHMLVNAFRNFIQQVVDGSHHIENGLLQITMLPLILLGGWFFVRRFLRGMEIDIQQDKQRFSTNIIYIILELVRRNIGSMLILIALFSLMVSIHTINSVFLALFSVFLCFKIFLSISKLTLLENTSDLSGKDVKLYYRIRLSLLLGFLLASLTVIAQLMPVAYEAKMLVDRIFMVFVLIIAVQFFKARTYAPNLLESIIHIPRRYFYRILQLLSIIIPTSLLINAVIGLLGYVELAWAVAKYQVIFILVLAGYLLIRGLLIDAMEFLSELLIRYVNQGWLWTEAILKPLDRVFRIVLLSLSSIFLLHLYHLDSNELFINSVHELLLRKLFALGGNTINLLLLCELLVIISLIKWLSHWSREFSYRWLYAKAKDVGLRNSLSTFTQYTSVIISVLLGLKFLGIDLRGFTVVAAAFAAGIGFGMRDLIINFFSGILLLIERPFRTGDIITLGSYEGEVVVTGMRSMTIRTWDHMEVIVPNADMFTKPFVNWTHHDNIVRTVITLKINREDDPCKVQHLILELLKTLPLIVKTPASEVLMNELSESLIEMQVRYFVCLTGHKTRAEIRSEVLFAIWDCFKTNNIRAPYPQYDLVVKGSRREFFDAKDYTVQS
jgi:potassium-dependent mechanosensitive channel